MFEKLIDLFCWASMYRFERTRHNAGFMVVDHLADNFFPRLQAVSSRARSEKQSTTGAASDRVTGEGSDSEDHTSDDVGWRPNRRKKKVRIAPCRCQLFHVTNECSPAPMCSPPATSAPDVPRRTARQLQIRQNRARLRVRVRFFVCAGQRPPIVAASRCSDAQSLSDTRHPHVFVFSGGKARGGRASRSCGPCLRAPQRKDARRRGQLMRALL